MLRKLILISILLTSLTGCGSLHLKTQAATAVDVGSTSYGLITQMAVEANPIARVSPKAFAVIIPARIIGVEYVNTLDEPTRTNNLSMLNSVWWGVDANNLVYLMSGSSPLGIVLGTIVGFALWHYDSMEREFMAICANEKKINPNIKCQFKRP